MSMTRIEYVAGQRVPRNAAVLLQPVVLSMGDKAGAGIKTAPPGAVVVFDREAEREAYINKGYARAVRKGGTGGDGADA